MGGGSSAPEAASLVFRIATVGLSLASAIMTAASTQCVYRDNGVPAGTVSYGDYASFKYSALADLLSAVLQGVAIFLEATRKDRAARAVELIDKLVQALTSTSAALLLAVDDITSCGGTLRGGGSRDRQGLCGQAGAFCGRLRVSSAFSIAATVSVSVSVYTRHAPVAALLLLRPAASSETSVNVIVERKDDEDRRGKKEEKCKVELELIMPEKTQQVKMKEDTKENKKEEDEVKKDDKGEEKKEDGEVEKEGRCCWSIQTGKYAGGGAATVVPVPEADDPVRMRGPRVVRRLLLAALFR